MKNSLRDQYENLFPERLQDADKAFAESLYTEWLENEMGKKDEEIRVVRKERDAFEEAYKKVNDLLELYEKYIQPKPSV